jgi:broad specificity phosphatase PhoE
MTHGEMQKVKTFVLGKRKFEYMAKIYFVRHGNAAHGWGEKQDPQLSDLGRKQAAETAQMMKPMGPMPLLASPLRRTRETAAFFSTIWGLSPQIEPLIAEIPTPSDNSVDRIEWLRATMLERWSNLSQDLQDWRQGVIDALFSLNKDSVLVSHFIAINAAVGEALGDDRVVVFKPGNASVTILETQQDKLTLIKLGNEDQTKIL